MRTSVTVDVRVPPPCAAGESSRRESPFRLRRVLAVASVIASSGFLVLCVHSSLYFLLSSIPFTYSVWIHNPAAGWVIVSPAVYRVIYCLIVPFVVAEWLNAPLRNEARRLAIGFALWHGFIAVALWLVPREAQAPNDFRSFVWSLLPFTSLVWLWAIEHVAAEDEDEPFARLRPGAAVAASVFVFCTYEFAAFLQPATQGGPWP